MPRLLSRNSKSGDDSKTVKGVVFSAHEWNRITGHALSKGNQQKQAELKAEEREGRLQMSKQMASTWGNTLVNLRRKRIAQRQEKIENEIKARHERYLYFKAEDEKRKELIRMKARNMFFEMRDGTKTLRSAEKLSEALRERQQQAEFCRQLKEKEKEQTMEEAKKIWADVEKYKKEEEEMFGEHSKRKEERKKEALKELEEYRKEQEEKLDAQKREELLQLEGMKKELEQIEEYEKQERQRIKREYWEEVTENRQATQRKRQAALEESREEDLAIEIINRGKARMAQLRREKEAEALKEGIQKRERVASLVVAATKNKDELEQAILRKASLEKDRVFKQEEQKRKEHAERLRLERIETHQNYLKEEARKKEAERELIKWAVLQRFKNDETTTGVQKKVNSIRHQRYLECREANAKLMEEHNEKLAKEKQADLDAVRRAAAIWALHDKEFLDLAKKVRDECIAAGRPSHPLDVCIADFKKRSGLLKECRGVGFVDAIPLVPGYKEMAEKLKLMDSAADTKPKEVMMNSSAENGANK